MFSFRRRPPVKLHLGVVRVVPRRDVWRHLEAGLQQGKELRPSLLAVLGESFGYADAADVAKPGDGDGDVCVDIAVESHSRGGFTDFALDFAALPLGWRPKICLCARLYGIQDGKQRMVARVVERMGWGEYLLSLANWRVLIGLADPASDERFAKILLLAGQRLKRKIEVSISSA